MSSLHPLRLPGSRILKEPKPWRLWRSLLLLGLWILATESRASAHSSSRAFLHLRRTTEAIHGRVEIPLRDLEERLGLDANDDGSLTWGEIRRREQDLCDYVTRRLVFEAKGGRVPLGLAPVEVSRHEGEPYLSLDLNVSPIPQTDEFRIRYAILLDQDSLHQCLIQAEWSGETRIAAHGREEVSFPAVSTAVPGIPWTSLVTEGAHHIWTGYDHLLFLFALLLPSVLHRTRTGWVPAGRSRDVVREVVKVVTAFTVAHSITLCAATLGWIHLPGRFVETTIAASILLAALANLTGSPPPNSMDSPWRFNLPPWIRPRGWMVAFTFGLIHGFGFASVLETLGLERGGLLHPLIGFNIGVEAGQLAVVALFLPVALWLRSSQLYRTAVLPGASILILLLAGGWMLERALDLRFMPF
ncbi:MAG: HupE/UreJ family protein [Verrucomicrobiales bacterium]|nr:HupE/UreJ family protein [Verrucomicrobiales bacterium]